ncbi:hypothetical protein SAMN02799624_02600 [Paenibacillus sp. UNC496MF]|uniref:hypothetical protein n=1 Tax=Paenibacillus sp. UNC496MF TaxID=1502753 RepID=UPI0008EE231C|nr:hypothetical protein SAMN02799624_02600 [Paenibacillus sp. UNC496MF]
MAVVKSDSAEAKPARLLRPEAERVSGNCLDVRNIRTIQQMVYRSPGGSQPAARREQRLVDKYKAHCFYAPESFDCPAVYEQSHPFKKARSYILCLTVTGTTQR